MPYTSLSAPFARFFVVCIYIPKLISMFYDE